MTVRIEFVNGRTGEKSKSYLSEFVQITYEVLRVGPESDEILATYMDEGWWMTDDGRKWTDVIIDQFGS